jgi:hypothetical protein
MEIGLVKPPEGILNTIPSVLDFTSFTPLVLLSLMMIVLIGVAIKKPKGLAVLVMLFACISTSFMLPVQAVVYDYGSPLTTASIGLFAYYNKGVPIVLADTVTGWEAYTDYGTYYDGIVRVRMGTSLTTFTGTMHEYIDVPVRVRDDGWIMAWVTTAQSEKYIPFFTHMLAYNEGGGTPTAFTDYQTSLARAMYRILYCANVVGTYTYDDVGYYDYELPTATKLIMIHAYATSNLQAELYRKLYFSIPSGTVVKSFSISAHYCSYQYITYAFYFDTNLLASSGSRDNYDGVDTTAYTTTAKTHEVYISDLYTGGNKSTDFQIVQLIWMS